MMDQAPKKLKTLLLLKAQDESESWSDFEKALRSFTDLDVEAAPETLNEALIEKYSSGAYTKIFAAPELIPEKEDFSSLVVVVTKENLLLKEENIARKRALSRYSWIQPSSFPSNDLVRVLHQYLVPKSNPGVTPLMEKGSVVLGEKIQSLETMGAVADKVCAYLANLHEFELSGRLADVHQMISSCVYAALKTSLGRQGQYPALDFQISANKKKIAFSMRFPSPVQEGRDVIPRTVFAGDLHWHLLWKSVDSLMVTIHKKYSEVEIHGIINQENTNYTIHKQLLIKEQEDGAPKSSLLGTSKNYKFMLISELKVKSGQRIESTWGEADEVTPDLDGIPEQALQKIKENEMKVEALKGFVEKKNQLIKNLQGELSVNTSELEKRQKEVLKLVKLNRIEKEKFLEKIRDLESKVRPGASEAPPPGKEAPSAPAIDPGLSQGIAKLESLLKASETEKAQLQEKLNQEKKRLSMHEQKYGILFKDIKSKETEIQELKALLMKKNKDSNESSGSDNGGSQEKSGAGTASSAKIKDMELREQALKQELKKTMYKLEQQEKNLKVIQTESENKIKLMEQKLQGAKTKEVELIKKIDELGQALKKTKAA